MSNKKKGRRKIFIARNNKGRNDNREFTD